MTGVLWAGNCLRELDLVKLADGVQQRRDVGLQGIKLTSVVITLVACVDQKACIFSGHLVIPGIGYRRGNTLGRCSRTHRGLIGHR